MKKLTLLLVAAFMISGGAFAQDKACCKKGAKCTKSSTCCKDKKNCSKAGDKSASAPAPAAKKEAVKQAY